jgi:hypothetical protein
MEQDQTRIAKIEYDLRELKATVDKIDRFIDQMQDLISKGNEQVFDSLSTCRRAIDDLYKRSDIDRKAMSEAIDAIYRRFSEIDDRLIPTFYKTFPKQVGFVRQLENIFRKRAKD